MSAVATDAGTRREALAAASDAFAATGIESPRLDAEVLLAAALGCERASLHLDLDAGVPAGTARELAALVRRRLRREPVAYVLGVKSFRRLELRVDRRVLVPRPETELLVEVALERAPRRVLDVGTGSGAIALALADELPGCELIATDTSPGALALARENAARLGFADRVELRAGTVPAGERFDLLLANLPYVAERDWPSLAPEVREWEPREALLAGPDGLDAYRALFAASIDGVGAVAVEVGEGQAPPVARLIGEAGFPRTEARRDLAGIERVVVGER